MSESKENRLAKSASPYLRSAAHQTVDWYEWGDDAFARAKAEDKPILLDIGAVWCHWCHVIDRESYENPEIGKIINDNFVPVKVDRDERPDVDARYQAAISAISGQGGWPLTGFLTPDGKPFFGGTYFPPEDAMGRPGFRRILLSLAEAYKTRRGDVDRSATALAEAVAKAEMFSGAAGRFDAKVADEMVEAMTGMFDSRNGGFGTSPKFPHPTGIELLLEKYQSGRDPAVLEMAEKTLAAMARGGMYDHLAGGFHRYSVDERWCVPHFEKMSYDNSELLKNYVHGWQVTGRPLFRETAEGIIGWVNAELSDQGRGGFYASQDADYSLEDDGDYFTWTQEEVRAVLTAPEAEVIALHFDVEAHGEMHHNPAKNVLWVARDAAEIAKALGKAETEVRLLLARAKEKLMEARRARPTPYIDTTMYVSWNAMFCSAYLDAGRVLGREDCTAFALKTIDRILAEAWHDERGFAHRVGGEWLWGSLDDQVFAAMALLDAYEATLEAKYFQAAERAMQLALRKYYDAENGAFFDRSSDAPPMGGLDVRRKPFQDSPTPGANSIAALALERLGAYTDAKVYREAAERTLEAFAGVAAKYGFFAATYGLAAILHARLPIEVVVTGSAGNAEAERLERAAVQAYRFGKAVLRVTPEVASGDGLAPALKQTLPHLRADAAQALVCSGTTCQAPVTEADKLAALLMGATTGAATA